MIKRSSLLNKVVPIVLVGTLLLVGAGYPTEEKTQTVISAEDETVTSIGAGLYYSEVLKQYAEKGYVSYDGESITAEVADDSLTGTHTLDGEEHIGIMWDAEQESVSYSVIVPQDGLYQIGCVYRPLGDNGAPITRSLSIDGLIPFREAISLEFLRTWQDTNAPLQDALGNDVRPFSKEIPRFIETLLQDSGGKNTAPLQIYLTAGTHTITFGYIDEPLFLEKVYLSAPKALPSYEEVLAEWQKDSAKKGNGKTVTFEAESYTHVLEKSDSVIGVEYSGDPAASPPALYETKMNYIGGGGFKDGNQSITWKFAVEASGYYKLALRVAQWYNDGLPSYRQILIDGAVPFSEWDCYSFEYNDKWYSEELSNAQGEPYLLWLDAGEHTLTLTVKMGAYANIEESLYDSTQDLSKLIRRIKLVTGENPDGNYDYEIERNIPGIVSDLEALKTSLVYCETVSRELAGKKSSMSNSFDSAVEQLDELIEDPDRIPKRLSDLETTLGNLGNWITTIKTVPLGIDWISVAAPDEVIPDKKATIFEYAWYWIVKLIDSFSKDYQSVSVVDTGVTADVELDVWVSRGADWCRLIKQMSDANFTPYNNAVIKLNMIPAGQISGVNPVMLSVASGNAPDVVLGVGSSVPVEYAVRNAIVDLSKLEGFEEIKNALHVEAFTPLEYLGGVYGLPETVNYRCMYYRTDIFDEIGLTPPDTWDEFYSTTLPVLYQNGLKCYIPMLYDVFLFQNGGAYYTDDGHYSALDSEAAFKAFKETCELNINYSIPIAANYFTRFRTGEMPLILGQAADYLTFTSASPEITGNWDISPVPATVNEDGTLNRSSSGSAIDCGIIMSQSEHVDEAWAFLKWWMGDDTQKTFANQIENQLGVTARYFSANKKAFSALPFSRDEFKVINAFFDSNIESPFVLGGYYTGRHLTNAWTRCVEGAEDFRDSLEEAVEDINIELRRKQIEYGIFPE